MAALKRIMKEIKNLEKDVLPNMSAGPVTTLDYFKWEASIQGPPDSPYEGGTFKLSIAFPQDYPFTPPTIKFLTQVYHPNVTTSNGNICLGVGSITTSGCTVYINSSTGGNITTTATFSYIAIG